MVLVVFQTRRLRKQTTLIISNIQIYDIIKTIQALKDSNILLKGLLKQLKMKEEKEEILQMLSGSLGASLLRNIFIGK